MAEQSLPTLVAHWKPYQLQHAGQAVAGTAAALVLLHAEGWTEANAALMPLAARARAKALAMVGHKSTLPTGLWMALITPRVLRGEFGHVAFYYRP